jgi:hypothetical protein
MSIVNSIATYGQEGFQLLQSTAQAVSAASLTVRVPLASASPSTFSPAVARGLWRMKLYNGGGTTPALVSMTVTAGDGTNTVTLDNFVPVAAITISSTAYVDVMGDFILDTAASSAGGSSGTLLFGGATFFTFTFTASGTSYTFSCDAEIAAAP